MKPYLLIAILIPFFTIYGNSQDKGYIAFSMGPGFPGGDFGSKDVNNDAAGFATTKTIYDITFAQKLGKNLGFTVLVRGQANGVDTDPLLDELTTQYPGVPWTTQSHNWGIYGALGGLYGSFPLGSEKLTLETRVMAGYLQASSPEISFSAYTDNHYYEETTHSATGASISYLIGAGLKYNIGSRLALLFNVDYMGANPEFKDVLTSARIDATWIKNEYNTFKQTFGTVNLGVGVGYRW